jgi:hypothetical protein
MPLRLNAWRRDRSETADRLLEQQELGDHRHAAAVDATKRLDTRLQDAADESSARILAAVEAVQLLEVRVFYVWCCSRRARARTSTRAYAHAYSRSSVYATILVHGRVPPS